VFLCYGVDEKHGEDAAKDGIDPGLKKSTTEHLEDQGGDIGKRWTVADGTPSLIHAKVSIQYQVSGIVDVFGTIHEDPPGVAQILGRIRGGKSDAKKGGEHQ